MNNTVNLPQRSSPPIPATVVIDAVVGTQSANFRRNLHAGEGKVRSCCHVTHLMVRVGDDPCGAAARTVATWQQRVRSVSYAGTREYTLFAPQISIVTQCDVKRFQERIPEMMRVWRGPMVVVVMLRSMAEMDDVLATVKENRFLAQCAPHTPRWMSACGANRQRLNGQFYALVTVLTVAGVAGDRWVDVHLVIPETYPDVLYPTNALRSLAEQWALTEWVFVLDADLVPNANAQVFDQVLRDALVDYIPQWREQEIQVRCPTHTTRADCAIPSFGPAALRRVFYRRDRRFVRV